MAPFIPIHALFVEGRLPRHIVCHDGQNLIDWQCFYARIINLNTHLTKRSEQRWLITNPEPLDFLIALLATLFAGKEAVIPPNVQPGTLTQLKSAYDANIEQLVSTHISASPSTVAPPLKTLDTEHAVISLYTSGSTGEPKQVRKTLAHIEAEIAVLESLWGGQLDNATIIATVPHHHIYGLIFRLLWPLSAGRMFDAITCANPDDIYERMCLLGETALVSSPAQLTRLPALISLSRLKPIPKLIFSSGGALPTSIARLFHQQLTTAPTEIFGSTETGGIAWRCQKDNDAWTPLPGIIVSSDHDGALLLTSPFIENAGSYRMQDTVELRSDNRFKLAGRLDRIVKIEEKRLSLPDMENKLLLHPWVNGAAVLVIAGKRQSIGAVITFNTFGCEQLAKLGKREASQQLRQHLAAYFELVLLPRYWRFPDELPFNAQGKLTQAALAALFAKKEDTKEISCVAA